MSVALIEGVRLRALADRRFAAERPLVKIEEGKILTDARKLIEDYGGVSTPRMRRKYNFGRGSMDLVTRFDHGNGISTKAIILEARDRSRLEIKIENSDSYFFFNNRGEGQIAKLNSYSGEEVCRLAGTKDVDQYRSLVDAIVEKQKQDPMRIFEPEPAEPVVIS